MRDLHVNITDGIPSEIYVAIGRGEYESHGGDYRLARDVADHAAETIKRLRNRLRKLEGTNDHPEHRCERCGGRNMHSWYADSDVWNRVAGEYGVLCPICFSELAEAAGVSPTAWRVSIEGDDPELSKVRAQLHNQLKDGARLQAIADAVANLDGQEVHRSGLGSKQMVVRKYLYDVVCVAWSDWKAAEAKG